VAEYFIDVLRWRLSVTVARLWRLDQQTYSASSPVANGPSGDRLGMYPATRPTQPYILKGSSIEDCACGNGWQGYGKSRESCYL